MGNIAIASERAACVCQLNLISLKFWLDELDSSLTAQAHALRVSTTRDAALPKAVHPICLCPHAF